MAGVCKLCGREYGGAVCMRCAREPHWPQAREKYINSLFPPRIKNDLVKYESPTRTAIAHELVDKMLEEEGQGVYIYNEQTRSGKTLLAAEVVLAWLYEQHLQARRPEVSFTILSKVLQAQSVYRAKLFSSELKQWEPAPLDLCAEAPLLVLDDFGIENIEGKQIYEQIYGLVNERYEYLKPTIFTSNMSLEQLLSQFNDVRIPSRIGRMCSTIVRYHYLEGCEEDAN